MAIPGLNVVTTTQEGGVRGILDKSNFNLLSLEKEDGTLISATTISEYPDLEKSIATLQTNSPILDDESPINVNLSDSDLITEFVADREVSINNVETDNNVNSFHF